MTVRELPLEPLQLDAECCAPLGVDALDDRSAEQLAQAFKALGDPVRLRLLSIIASAPTGEVCACDLTEPVGKSQPTVSHHLKVLREAGLVTSRKHGTWVHYRAVPEQMGALCGVLSVAPRVVTPNSTTHATVDA
jgi:ArsR family transcriptional regulator